MRIAKRMIAFLFVTVLLMGVVPSSLAASDDEYFYERTQEKTDYAYSFAIVGDTQTHVYTDVQTLYDSSSSNDTAYTRNLYKWIVDNKEQKKIKWVFGLGDITENPNYSVAGSDEQEWVVAKNAIRQLDRAEIPYSLIRGNHDSIPQLNKYFGQTFYTSRITGYYDQSSIANHYINFKVAGTKYMVLCLEFGPKDEVLEWANEVVAAHPGRRVIVTTHFYLEPDGSLADENSSHAPNPNGVVSDQYTRNNGDMIWEKLIRKHRNIIMVMSGHFTSRNVGFSQRTGDHGNTVSQFLIDPQDSNFSEGFICMLYFSADGKKASVEWISTVRTQEAQKSDPNAQDILYKTSNQFDFVVTDLDYVGDDPVAPINAITTFGLEKKTTTTTTATSSTASAGSTSAVGNVTSGNAVVSSTTVTGVESTTASSDGSTLAVGATTATEPNGDSRPASTTVVVIAIVGGVVLLGAAALVISLVIAKKKGKSE